MANKLAAEQLKPLREYLLNGTKGKDAYLKTPKPKESPTACQMANDLATKQLEPLRKYLLD